MLHIIPYPNKVEIKDGYYLPPYRIDKKIEETNLGQEGYILEIDKNGISITSEGENGIYYGEQTLIQIFEQYPEGVPFVKITDTPKYNYRGFMLDCSRHFFTVKEIKKQLDVLAKLKINIFHWHLTDDQGWRIEIDKYPLLTEVGSKRKQTGKDSKPIEGYYTKKEIKEIIKYCDERFINIIPEVDMPGHFKAAIAAYPYISCREEKIYVGEGFGISPDIACGGKKATYDFCYDILDEIAELFPYKYIHLGGDEALKLYWLDCDHCQGMMKEQNLQNEEELQGYFMSKMVEYLSNKGKKVINWNDAMRGGNLEGDITVQYWKESKECKEVVEREAKNGRDIIISPFFSYYLDYPHAMTPLSKTYNYEINDTLKENVIGLEAPLWTEFVTNEKKLEEMAYPRIIAVAERAWSEENLYKSFLERLESFKKVLDRYNINYNKKPNPSIIDKIGLIKFYFNAMSKIGKGNINAMRETAKKLKQKYKDK